MKTTQTAIIAAIILTCTLLAPADPTYSGGDGTPANPYQIADANDFLDLSATPTHWNKHFILTANLNLADHPFTQAPIGSTVWNIPFTGVFDGNNYTISSLTITAPDNDYIGLFGALGPNGLIHNLGVENISVVGRLRVGGLCGLNSGGTIQRCYITGGSVTAIGAGNSWAGGLTGAVNLDGIVSDCYSTANVFGDSRVGGLVGQLGSGWIRRCYAAGHVTADGDNVGGLVGHIYHADASGTISDSYAVGDVSGNTNVGGLVGNNHRGKVVHCYSAGKPTGTAAVGGLCGTVTKDTGFEDTGNFWDTQTSQRSTSTMGTGKTTAQMKTLASFTSAWWNFVATWWMIENQTYPQLLEEPLDYSGGLGTAENPYQIGSIAAWQTLMSSPYDWKKYFVMTADINLAGVVLTPVGNESIRFTGIFDGSGHVIYNAVINQPQMDYVGLFGVIIYPGRVSNLGIENIQVTGGWATGGLAGFNDYWEPLWPTHIVPTGPGRITSCYVTGEVSGNLYVGGLVGLNVGTILYSYSTASVNDRYYHHHGQQYAGGLAGANAGFIIDCYAAGMVNSAYLSSGGIGGLIGINYDFLFDPTVTSCFWDVQTTGQNNGIGQGEPGDVTGKTTAEMQTLSTFTDEDWDFVETWAICEGTNYPRLQWQIPAADWLCPDGVGMEDLAYFAARWLMDDCGLSNDCQGADLTKDGTVNLDDFADLADLWLK